MKLFLLSVLFFSNVILAQNFKLTGQIRERTILNNADFSDNTAAFTYSELRSRLGVNFIPNSSLATFIQFQDVRVFGSEASTTDNSPNVDLFQAYGIVKNIFDLPVDWKFGRMQVKLANERLLGVSDWTTGRSFDGTTLGIKTSDVNFNVYAFQTNEKLLAGDSLDSFFGGISADFKSIPNYEASVFILSEVKSKTSGNNTTTIGFFASGDHQRFHHGTEAAYQFGNIKIANRNFTVSSCMFAYNFDYSFDFYWKPKAGGGIDFIGGDKNPNDKKYQSFSTLYGTGHRFYGFMDYFKNIPAHTKNLGLVDLHLKFGIKPAEDFSVNLNLHKFLSDAEYTKQNSSKTKDFGFEADLFSNYRYDENLNLLIGLSTFSPGEIFKEWKGKDNSLFGYFLATINL